MSGIQSELFNMFYGDIHKSFRVSSNFRMTIQKKYEMSKTRPIAYFECSHF